MYVFFLLTRFFFFHKKGSDCFFLEDNISYHPLINELLKYAAERDLKKEM